MLLRTIFLLIFVGALAESMLAAGHALAQAALHRQASLAVAAELQSAQTQAADAIAAAIAAGAAPGNPLPVAPSPSATCRLSSQNGCAIEGTATIAFATPAASTATPCADAACTVYEQGNADVGEGRIDAVLTANAVASDGSVLAQRSYGVRFRTMLFPPYVAQAGALDGSLDGPGTYGPGNDAGATPVGTAPGTLVDVLYQNRVTGATMPANVWQAKTESPPSTATSWSP